MEQIFEWLSLYLLIISKEAVPGYKVWDLTPGEVFFIMCFSRSLTYIQCTQHVFTRYTWSQMKRECALFFCTFNHQDITCRVVKCTSDWWYHWRLTCTFVRYNSAVKRENLLEDRSGYGPSPINGHKFLFCLKWFWQPCWLKSHFLYRFAKFQELIAVQTGVSARQQMLMFKYEEFRPDPMAPASSYPNTTVRIQTTELFTKDLRQGWCQTEE